MVNTSVTGEGLTCAGYIYDTINTDDVTACARRLSYIQSTKMNLWFLL